MAHHLAEPLDEVVELLGACRGRHRRAQRAVGVGEVAQHDALGPGQLVVGDELPERHGPLVHLAHHRLRRQAARVDPRVGLPVDAQSGLELLDHRPRPADVVEGVHPLLVVEPVGLHRPDRLATSLEALGHQHRSRVVERRLDDAHDVECVARRLGVEHLEHGQGEGRQRLVEREAVAEVERHLERALGEAPLVAAHEVLERPDLADLRDDLGRRVVRRRPGPGWSVVAWPAAASSSPIGPRSAVAASGRSSASGASSSSTGVGRFAARRAQRQPLLDGRTVVGLDDLGAQQRREHLHGPLDECVPAGRFLVVVEQQGDQGGLLALPLVEHVEHHARG